MEQSRLWQDIVILQNTITINEHMDIHTHEEKIMPTYKFDYELHHEIIARNKKEAEKKARALMRKRKKSGVWWSAKLKKTDNNPKFPKTKKRSKRKRWDKCLNILFMEKERVKMTFFNLNINLKNLQLRQEKRQEIWDMMLILEDRTDLYQNKRNRNGDVVNDEERTT
jgi:hypothetical protein